MKQVSIYSDGSCRKTKRGGYGVVLIYGNKRKELSGTVEGTTNNRMEILAVIKGLEALKEPCKVTVFSDSQYVVNIHKSRWFDKWMKNGWITAAKEPVKNKDLLEKLIEFDKIHELTFTWVRGHGTCIENIKADELATNASLI